MKFALIYQVQLPKPWTDRGEYQLFQNILTQVSFAEEMGFESVWSMEHHFAPEQSHSSAPDMILAALSQRTSSMRLGLAVVLTPVHHPLQTAERLATLDLLSGGRVELGVGRSGHPYQLTPFGVMEDCIKFIEQFEAIGVEELMFNFQLGPVAHEEVMESIRLFGKYVIPAYHQK